MIDFDSIFDFAYVAFVLTFVICYLTMGGNPPERKA